MDENPKPKSSWWQTLPGVLTAAAATATAIAGLIGAIHQAGFFRDLPAQDHSTSMTSDVAKGAAPSSTKISLIGSWSGSPSCLVVFYQDDGQSIEGSCDVKGYRHKISGTYGDKKNIAIMITRTDPEGCVTNAHGFIKIINQDNISMGQNGWNGCRVTTESVTTSLSRSTN